MRILVTGAGGMMGSHLLDYLIDRKQKVLGLDFVPTTDISQLNKEAQYVECDIRDKEKLSNLLNAFKPEIIFHLAAQSYPTVSWYRPNYTLETNIIGTANIFEVIKELNLNPIILIAGSSAEYGFVEESEVPVSEKKELKPLHPYGVSKVAQEMLAYQYHKNFGMKTFTIRIFNTTGPKKINDVCSDFTKQIVMMEKGLQEPILRVGNLYAKRAITDVRDLIEAFWLAVHHCKPGESYNVSGEKVYQVKEIVDLLKKLTKINFTESVEKSLLRTTDEKIIYGDSAKFKETTGWTQKISIEQTLSDMLDCWRKVL